MQLSEYVDMGRNNNFNLLRMIAASMVLVSHSFALSTGDRASEPLRVLIGMTPGNIAVDIFFITSGFLVTKSIDTNNNIKEYILSRALRIYPGLITSVLLTVITIGLMFRYTDFVHFMASKQTLSFITTNCASTLKTKFTIPGIFTDTPYKGTINGSLWTLPYEIKMYASLAAVWIVNRLFFNNKRQFLTTTCIAITLLASFIYVSRYGFEFAEFTITRLTILFYSGSSIYLLRNKIRMSNSLAIILLMFIAACAAYNEQTFFIAYMLSMPYITIYIAYVPSGTIRKYNTFGDYSYGIYIYGFPVQQIIASTINPITPIQMLITSSFVSIVLAVLSWHMIESRALKSKAAIHRLFSPIYSTS